MKRKFRAANGPALDQNAIFRLLPEQLPVIVYVYDLQAGRTVYTNQRTADVLGYPLDGEAYDNEFLRNILHPDNTEIVDRMRERYSGVSDNEIVTAVFRVRAASGQWHWLRTRDIILSRLPDGSPHLILGTAEDFTEQHEAAEHEKEIRRQIESDQQRLRQLLELNERERRMVAYDVHDGFVQDVVGAQLAIEAMLDRLARTDPESVAPLLRVRAFVRRAIDEARRVVSELRPATVDDGGLVEAIQFLTNEAEIAHRLDVKFTYPPDFPELSSLLVKALVRIVQEALNNVRRHAGTKEASIHLGRVGNRVQLKIQDNGVGFNPAEVPPGHFGLEGMRERARVFGGRVNIRSGRNKGTCITVTVPIERPPAGSSLPPLPHAARPSVKNRANGAAPRSRKKGKPRS